MTETPQHYQEAGWFTRNVFNKAVAGLTGLGIPILGSRILAVRAVRAASGAPRRSIS